MSDTAHSRKAGQAGGSTYHTHVIVDSAGIEQSDDMKRFLWYCYPSKESKDWADPLVRNNHFAAVAADQPGLEVMFRRRSSPTWC